MIFILIVAADLDVFCGTPVSSINKMDCHDITVLLLKEPAIKHQFGQKDMYS
jgi:hypothetical protein